MKAVGSVSRRAAIHDRSGHRGHFAAPCRNSGRRRRGQGRDPVKEGGVQLVFDFDAEMEDGRRECEPPQTRCYTFTGAASVLDSLEAVLRRIEWIGEKEVTRLVSAFVDGAGGAKVAVRVLGSWIEEGVGGERGATLRRLADEERIAAHYLHDVSACSPPCRGRV